MRSMLLAAAMLLAPGAASAAAFTNGSFEDGTVSDPFSTLGAGSTAIDSWVVGGNGVDYISTLWKASDGDRSLDLSAISNGSISQTFDTVELQTYRVSFDLAGNSGGAPTVKSLSVFATGNAPGTQTFDTTGTTFTDMGWQRRTYQFVARGRSTTLTFASNDATAFGPALDNVSVTAVPEPATWAMMIGGFGLVGGAMRRRRGVGVAVRA